MLLPMFIWCIIWDHGRIFTKKKKKTISVEEEQQG